MIGHGFITKQKLNKTKKNVVMSCWYGGVKSEKPICIPTEVTVNRNEKIAMHFVKS
jgi:hypothetical protein